MGMADHANETVKYIYQEGDIDLIFFGHILSMVSADAEDIPLKKNPERRLSDAIKLVDFLVSSGDFYVGRTVMQQDGTYSDVPFENGFQDFLGAVNETFSQKGIDDIDLLTGSWIKKTQVGRDAPPISSEISSLFSD